MGENRATVIPEGKRTADGPGPGAGNRKLLKRHIVRAEALCNDQKFQAKVQAARITWNEKYPKYRINPDYYRASENKYLPLASLAHAAKYAWEHDDKEKWSSFEPELNDWYECVAGLNLAAFEPLVYDTGFAEGLAIGSRFIEIYLLQGPGVLRGNCRKYFPSLQQVYEDLARRIINRGGWLRVDAIATAEDLKDFAQYALPIVKAKSHNGNTFTGLAIEGLASAGFDRRDIAHRLGLTPRTVKERLQARR